MVQLLRDLTAVGKLARALGVSLRELLLDEPEMLPSPSVVETAPNAIFDEMPFVDGVFRISIHRMHTRSQK